MGDGWIRRSHCMAMADSSLFEESTWGFHLQQAIEKALKAWLLVLSPEQPPFSHNLRLLFLMLRDQDAAVEPFLGLSLITPLSLIRTGAGMEVTSLNPNGIALCCSCTQSGVYLFN
ncbi:HEPN domain-containing protein [Synechococcus lacustris]|uniref:HEPN domain-containing protein n=1 Tax=Synechococcus lacustris TaxID=2116544 RepID=UPI0028F40276|nr:HEPN domain-containing protein [Synechococcus lacustris]